jgi:hypothetical protein
MRFCCQFFISFDMFEVCNSAGLGLLFNFHLNDILKLKKKKIC